MSEATIRLAELGRGRKVLLALDILLKARIVETRMRRTPLPELVSGSGTASVGRADGLSPEALGRAVSRVLGPRDKRCLIQALVLFRLLQDRGERPELVIGLLPASVDHAAHAWVEIGGRDVGPPPGRNGHIEMARFA